MRLLLKETRKDYFDADFVIMRGDRFLGGAQVMDCYPEDTGQMLVHFREETVRLFYTPKEGRFSGYDPQYRHNIEKNKETSGSLTRESAGSGLFGKYQYIRLEYNGAVYSAYEIKLGDKGICWPVYNKDKLIAQCYLDPEIENDLYNYRISAIDEESAYAALLCCCYQYYAFTFVPGKELKPVYDLGSGRTRNTKLLSRYDPDFETGIAD